MARVRVELDRAGIGKLLTSDEVQSMLDDRAERVAAQARSAGITVGSHDTTPLPIETESAGGRTRARALVIADHEAGLAVEAKHRLLGRSIGAA